MFEGTYEAPYYNDLYGFSDGAQHDVFFDGVIASQASFTVTTPASAPTTYASAASSNAAAATTYVEAASSQAAEPASSYVAEPSSSPAAEPAQSSTTSSASSTSSTAAWYVQSFPSQVRSTDQSTQSRKRGGSKKKRDAKVKRSHARHLSALHH